jgi:hypothetical protein
LHLVQVNSRFRLLGDKDFGPHDGWLSPLYSRRYLSMDYRAAEV